MYDHEMYEISGEFEQALHTALLREPAPDRLILRVERRLLEARAVSPAPAFRLLSLPDRSAGASLWSLAAHAAVFALVALLLIHTKGKIAKDEKLTQLKVTSFVPVAVPSRETTGGGGGGGAHDILQSPRGKLPKAMDQPITPPMVAANDHPRLAQEPAIVMPKDMQLRSDLPNLGSPRTNVAGPASNGPGSGAGMGTGTGGGIGSGYGAGYGPGEGGGYGGGLYHVGGGVAAPQLIYSVDAEFSDEARRAKFQGVCVVSLVVDAQGNPQRIQVVRRLGMGLDQKAIAAVKQYKFKPATLQGKPVPVEVNVEVNFRIY